MKEFAEQLKKIQDERRITQKQMAEIVGVSQNTISAYMRDIKSPTLDLVARFAKALGVSIGYLCGEEQNTSSISFKNYGDVVSMLARIKALPLTQKSKFSLLPKATCVSDGQILGTDMVMLLTQDAVLKKFYHDDQEMFRLFACDTIDNETYASWLMKKTNELSKMPLPFASKEELEELPF